MKGCWNNRLFVWITYSMALDNTVYFERCGCRNLVETSTKLRPNFDTPSVDVWSKFARYINDIHCKFDKTKHVYQTATPNFDQTSTKLRPNFDTRGVEVWSNWWRSQQPANSLLFWNKTHICVLNGIVRTNMCLSQIIDDCFHKQKHIRCCSATLQTNSLCCWIQ